MKHHIFKRIAAIAAAILILPAMAVTALAEDDIVLSESGSAFIGTFDPGEGTAYKYMGYAYCYEAGPEYKYLQITYTGDATAFDQLRLEFVVNSDDDGEKKLPPCWFRQNDEGTILTVDGEEVPAPSDTEQTVVIDLEKSGIDLTTGIVAFHIHDTQGTGAFTITDARLMTSPNGAGASGDTEAADETEAQENEEQTTAGVVDEAQKKTGKTAKDYVPIAVIAGGAVVVGAGAYLISRKMKF